MPFIHSKLSIFKLDNAAGALQDISQYTDKVNPKYELGEVNVTTFGQTFEQFIAGFASGEIDIGGNWDRTFDTQMTGLVDAFRAGTITSSTFEYGPEGADSGDHRATGEAVLTNYEVDSSIQDQVTWTATLRCTGTITFNSY